MKYIDNFLEYLYVIKKHSEHTINNYKIDLIDFLEFNKNNVKNVDRDTVNRYMQYLYDKNVSRATISRKLSSLRSFYNYLYKNQIVRKNYFSSIKNPKKENSLPKFVKEIDIDKMFGIPDIGKPNGQRNLLIIRMLYATGVRVSELVNIKISDIDINERTIKIFGKGSKERIVVFGNNALAKIDANKKDIRNQVLELYPELDGEEKKTKNVIHASDCVEAAATEIEIFQDLVAQKENKTTV